VLEGAFSPFSQAGFEGFLVQMAKDGVQGARGGGFAVFEAEFASEFASLEAGPKSDFHSPLCA
jgi:hypothetical protein